MKSLLGTYILVRFSGGIPYLIIDYDELINSLPTNHDESLWNSNYGNYLFRVNNNNDDPQYTIMGDYRILLGPARLLLYNAFSGEFSEVGHNRLMSMLLKRYSASQNIYIPINASSTEYERKISQKSLNMRRTLRLIPGLFVVKNNAIVILDIKEYKPSMSSSLFFDVTLVAQEIYIEENGESNVSHKQIKIIGDKSFRYDMLFGYKWRQNGKGKAACASNYRAWHQTINSLVATYDGECLTLFAPEINVKEML